MNSCIEFIGVTAFLRPLKMSKLRNLWENKFYSTIHCIKQIYKKFIVKICKETPSTQYILYNYSLCYFPTSFASLDLYDLTSLELIIGILVL